MKIYLKKEVKIIRKKYTSPSLTKLNVKQTMGGRHWQKEEGPKDGQIS